jgi:hypothetical protein
MVYFRLTLPLQAAAVRQNPSAPQIKSAWLFCNNDQGPLTLIHDHFERLQ